MGTVSPVVMEELARHKALVHFVSTSGPINSPEKAHEYRLALEAAYPGLKKKWAETFEAIKPNDR